MSKPLPAAPSLEQLKKQAKELLTSIQDNAPTAVERFRQHLPRWQESAVASGATGLKLSDAQLVLAREYGFSSWPKLQRHVASLSEHEIPARQQALDEAMIRAAVKQKDRSRVQELLAAGANINGRLAQVGTTALGWAACGEVNLPMMEFLLASGAAVDRPANFDSTPLACAAFKGNVKATELLLAHDAAVNHPQPGNYTVLHCGTYSGNTEVVRLLLEAGAKVNVQTTDGQFGRYWFDLAYCGETPLHNAMAYGKQEMIQLLLDAGAKLGLKTRHGETALQWAGRHQRPKALMKWLQTLTDK